MTNHYPRWKLLGLFASTALALVVQAGCESTPNKQWGAARETLTTAQDAIVALYPNVIDRETAIQTSLFLQPAQESLWKAWTLLPEGGPVFEKYLESVSAGVTKAQQLSREDVK